MLRVTPWVAALVVAGTAGAPRDAAADEPAPVPLEVEETGPQVAPWDDHDLVPIPEDDGVPLDEIYPVLAAWVHPVADTDELIPVRALRKFGAARDGKRRTRGTNRRGCRRRHCGVDLAGPRGRTIVAAMDGAVKHIERRRNGKDGLSGRYVRIAHDGGVFTAYMHLDSIAPGLRVGARVTAGQFLGRLGRSGIRHGDPHLHLNLEIPGADGATAWDGTRLFDATPFLQRARVIADPNPRERRGNRPQT